MVKKAKKTRRRWRRWVVYPLVAGMLAGGACYIKPKVVKLQELAKAFKEVKDPEDRFSTIFIYEYMKLLNKGIPPKAISKIPCYMFEDIIKGLKSEEMPEQLIPYFTHSQKEYSIIAAAHNPVFGTDKEKIRSHIKEQLSKVPHLSRENTDYRENAFQVDSIENINMLYLIKGYIDYFQNKDNRKEISKQIREDLADPFSEHGGLVISGNGKYEFVNVSPLEERVKNLENNGSYFEKKWARYIGAVGGYHFHATKEDDGKHAGPSGSAQSDYKFLNGDIGLLIIANELNPYRIDCVITKMKGDRFNADIYFRDTRKGRSNSEKTTVIDLGVFDIVKGRD